MKILAASLLLVGATGPVRADNTLEANGPGQNRVSILHVYSTSTRLIRTRILCARPIADNSRSKWRQLPSN